MYLALRGPKKIHHIQQRSHGSNDYKLSTVNRKKYRFRNVATGMILSMCLLWICVSFHFFRSLSSESGNDVFHRIEESHLRQIVSNKPNRDDSGRKVPTTRQKWIEPHVTDSPYKIVHSLTTRFMLGQKGHPTLARARYLLFETFCQPTVRYQTAQEASERYEFSWFVLADPGLDKDIIDDLQALLSQDGDGSGTSGFFPKGNAYLLLTDNPSWAADGVGVPGVTGYGAGFEEIARGIRDGSIQPLTGNATRLIGTLEEDFEKRTTTNDKNGIEKPLLLIETMLDADDGLNNQAIQWIQDLAVSHTQQQRLEPEVSTGKLRNSHNAIAPSLNSTWWLLCGTDHIEWHNRDIYRLTDKQYDRYGLSSGIIGLRRAPQYCASAGFTRVGLTTERSTPDARPLVFPQVAYSNHALATEEFDHCSEGTGFDTRRKANNNTGTLMSRCFRRDFQGVPFVLKGRTITSDSMDHMAVRPGDYRDLPWEGKEEHPLLGLNETEKMWGIAANDFSIDRHKAQKTSIYLREHLESILQENSESRCAPGFPCREVADVAFKKMIKHVGRLKKINKQQSK